MRSTFSGIEISKRSLFAQQTALQTTGHNIANANTAGYTRQIVNLTASRPIEAVGLMRSNVPGQLGQGVEFDSIRRIREKFLDTQFYKENQDYGSWGERKDTLEKLEAIFNEPSDTGVRQVIENFWKAWQVASKEPENLTARAALKESSLAMTDGINHTAQQLKSLFEDLTENINVKVSDINTTLGQIARLNNEIFRVEGLGNDANDLRDQRDLLADKLSEIVNITVDETEGGYNIRMGGRALVTGTNVDADVTAEFLIDAVSSGDIKSGQVYGMVVSRDQYVKSYQFQLNSMVKSLVEGEVEITLPKGSVIPDGTKLGDKTYSGTIAQRTLAEDTIVKVKGINSIHNLGYTLENPTKSGIDFFTTKDGSDTFDAANITLNPDIVKKVSMIAASSRVDEATGLIIKGNNTIALSIAGLRTEKFNFDPAADGTPILSNGSFEEFYRAMLGQLGVQSQEATRQTTNQKMLVDQIESRRQATSGVSLDEEMANMIKYQHAYNAAARSMTTFDEMLDKIINGMGVVGR